MPAFFRDQMEDLAPLLPEDKRSRYEALSAEERSGVHNHVWWLSDPFLSQGGNDRWAEHISRRLEVVLHNVALRAAGHTAGDLPVYDMDRVRRGAYDSYQGLVKTRAHGGGYDEYTSKRAAANHFLPDEFLLSGLSEDLRFRLDADYDDEGYTRLSGPVLQLPSQIARFREGDSLVVAMASDLGIAGVFGHGAGELGRPEVQPGAGEVYFLTSEGPDHVAVFDPAPPRERVALAGRIPNRMQLIGVEAFVQGVSARDRRVLTPLELDERLLSDLLLFQPQGPELPQTRTQAVGMMYGSVEVPGERELGVDWEGYGFPESDSVGVSVAIRGEEGGWLSALGRAIGVAGEVRGGALRWSAPTGQRDPFSRAITLNLAGVREGEYELVVSVELGDGGILTRSRAFEVVEGSGG
jgi:hypothetical protein